MGTRSKRSARCPDCRLHEADCLCAALPRVAVRTRVVVVMHRRERHKTTATGRLALLVIDGAELRLHGDREAPVDLADLVDPGRRLMSLFPESDASALTPALVARDPRPVTLVVPDGSWRQAARMGRRLPGLEAAERVTLLPGAPSGYSLRREPKEGGLATVEAIARALGVLEPDGAVQARLEAAFATFVDRVRASRGL